MAGAVIMATDRDTKHQRALALARRYAADLSEPDRFHLHAWAQELLDVRNSSASVLEKAQAGLRATARHGIARTAVVQLARRARELGISSRRQLWEERGWAARLGLLGGSIAGVAFAGQGAGIAALGGAVGVPLWLVAGAGGTFLGTLVDALAPTARSDSRAAIDARVIVVRTKRSLPSDSVGVPTRTTAGRSPKRALGVAPGKRQPAPSSKSRSAKGAVRGSVKRRRRGHQTTIKRTKPPMQRSRRLPRRSTD